MKMKHGGLLLTPRALNGGGTSTLLQCVCMVDPVLPVIPAWLINFVVRHLACLALQRMRTQIAGLAKNQVYQARIVAHDDFYGFIRRRMEEIQFPKS